MEILFCGNQTLIFLHCSLTLFFRVYFSSICWQSFFQFYVVVFFRIPCFIALFCIFVETFLKISTFGIVSLYALQNKCAILVYIFYNFLFQRIRALLNTDWKRLIFSIPKHNPEYDTHEVPQKLLLNISLKYLKHLKTFPNTIDMRYPQKLSVEYFFEISVR